MFQKRAQVLAGHHAVLFVCQVWRWFHQYWLYLSVNSEYRSWIWTITRCCFCEQSHVRSECGSIPEASGMCRRVLLWRNVTEDGHIDDGSIVTAVGAQCCWNAGIAYFKSSVVRTAETIHHPQRCSKNRNSSLISFHSLLDNYLFIYLSTYLFCNFDFFFISFTSFLNVCVARRISKKKVGRSSSHFMSAKRTKNLRWIPNNWKNLERIFGACRTLKKSFMLQHINFVVVVVVVSRFIRRLIYASLWF